MLEGLLGKLWYTGYLGESGDNALWWMLAMVLVAIAAYLAGSVNTAIIISKVFYGEDIRTKGSGNAGMTNMMRTYGKGPAIGTFLGDIFKTLVGMVIGTLLCGLNGAYLAGLFAILGHIAPVFYRFKGGKGVAATAMFVLYVEPLAFLFLLVIFVLLVWATKFLSLGSVIAVMIYPLMLFRMETFNVESIYPYMMWFRVIVSLIAALTVIYMHRSNIKRLLAGTENKFSFKKTQKPTKLTASEGDKAADTTKNSDTPEA